MVLHQLVALPGASRRPNAQLAPSSTCLSPLASRNTPPHSMTTPITNGQPNQLDQIAAKTTPEALRGLELMWRARRKAKLAEMRGEGGMEKFPMRVEVREEVRKVAGPAVGRSVLGDRQTNGQISSHTRGLTRQANVKAKGVISEGVALARTDRLTGGKNVEETGRIWTGSSEQQPVRKLCQPAEDTIRTTARHAYFAKTPAKKLRCSLPSAAISEELPRIATTPALISTARRITYDLLPTGVRRISKSNTLTIQQEYSVSTSTISHAPPSSRRLTFSTSSETYYLNEDGTEIIVEDRNGDGLKTKRIKLEEQGMWERKDRKRWELVFDMVERIKRHTERVTWNLPSGCLHLMCNSPSDIVYHHHASPLPISPSDHEPAKRTFSAGITLSPSRGIMQISVRRRWSERKGNTAETSEGLSSKRLIALPPANSVSQSIRILLERQRKLRQRPPGFKEVKATMNNGEGDNLWDSDELRALRSFQSSIILCETVAE